MRGGGGYTVVGRSIYGWLAWEGGICGRLAWEGGIYGRSAWEGGHLVIHSRHSTFVRIFIPLHPHLTLLILPPFPLLQNTLSLLVHLCPSATPAAAVGDKPFLEFGHGVFAAQRLSLALLMARPSKQHQLGVMSMAMSLHGRGGG